MKISSAKPVRSKAWVSDVANTESRGGTECPRPCQSIVCFRPMVVNGAEKLGHDKNARFVFGQMDEVQCPTAKTVHLQLPPNIMCQGILYDKSALEFGSCVIQSECSQQHHLVDQIKAPRLDGFIRCSAVCPDH